jgi:hypothetical protein
MDRYPYDTPPGARDWLLPDPHLEPPEWEEDSPRSRRTCDECQGAGRWIYDAAGADWYAGQPEICGPCDGTGTIEFIDDDD